MKRLLGSYETETLKNFAQNWLDIQSQSIDGLCSALFLLHDSESKALKPAAQWPHDNTEALELVAISKLALQRQEKVINSQETDQQTFDYQAVPIVINKQLIGIVAVKTTHHDEQTQQKIQQALIVGTKWLAMSQLTDQKPDHFYTTVVKLAVNCLQQESLKKALTVLMSDLTREYDCERVSIGTLKNHHIQVVALSNSAKFDDKSNLIKTISVAMDEAMDQDKITVYPQLEENKMAITVAHAELARKYGSGTICSIPLVHEEVIFAVLTMERSGDETFDAATINSCEQTLALISSFLKLKQDDEQPAIQKVFNSSKSFLSELFGFNYLGLKLSALATLAIVCFSLLTEGEYRIHANAVLEGRIQRTIPAPMKGFIHSAKVRAGDTVVKQQVLATMEDVDLKLEKIKLTAKQQQLQREYRDAMANRELVQVRILNAQLAQVNAKIKLKTEELQRTIIKAPFDGIVIKGDLSQKLGAPVDRGDSLFTLAPLDGYRVILKVDERSISYIRHDQRGVLALSSLPDQKFPLRIEKITQVAKTDDGANIFRVEATLDELPQSLRPGMEGLGKIEVGHKKLFWIWTHEWVDWLKLWVWSWWP